MNWETLIYYLIIGTLFLLGMGAVSRIWGWV